MQAQALQDDLYAMTAPCSVDCVLLLPLLRVLALFGAKRGCQPAACAGTTWQAALFERGRDVIVATLEQLSAFADDPDSALPHRPVDPTPTRAAGARRIQARCAGHTAEDMNGAVRSACVAIFACGHAALETATVPPPPVLSLVQALTVPTKLAALSSTLSPKLTPRCAPFRPRAGALPRAQNAESQPRLQGRRAARAARDDAGAVLGGAGQDLPRR